VYALSERWAGAHASEVSSPRGVDITTFEEVPSRSGSLSVHIFHHSVVKDHDFQGHVRATCVARDSLKAEWKAQPARFGAMLHKWGVTAWRPAA
jgi:hypothetical protein